MLAGYCWPQSVLPGEIVALHASTDAGRIDVEILRQGGEDRTVLEMPGVAVPALEVPTDCGSNGCGWPACASFEVGRDWPSGFYLVRMSAADGGTAEAFVVVRTTQAADALLVLSTSTWTAYNDWGGPSFYTGGVRSSMQRPLPRGFLAHDDPLRQRNARYQDWSAEEAARYWAKRYSPWCMAAGWANQELLFVRWAERLGVRLGFATSADLDREPGLLDGWPLYLSVGHDEYWTAAMRDAVEGYVDQGGTAAFFSGNTAFWQARFEDQQAALVSFKFALWDDPAYREGRHAHVTTMWSDPLVGRPETHMTGVTFTRGGYANMPNAPRGSGGYSVWRPGHWAFEGLSLRPGDIVGSEARVVGYECDGCELALENGLPVATGTGGTPANFEVLATAPAHLWETHELVAGLDERYVGELDWVAERIGGRNDADTRARFANGRAVMGAFRRGAGEVFTAGCTDWAYGLGDPAIDRITRNVLRRFGVALSA